MIRVVVAEDEPEIRTAIAIILDAQADLQVVGTAADGWEAVELTRRHGPDVVVMDLRMPALDGVAATRRILEDGGHVPAVLALTTFATEDVAVEAIRAGATGFCAKVDPTSSLPDAVRTVASGEAIVAPRLLAGVLRRLARPSPPRGAAGGCSPRELEVLALVAEGAGNREVAKRLFISEGTVRTHIEHLRQKLGARTRAQLVVRAHDLGICPGALSWDQEEAPRPGGKVWPRPLRAGRGGDPT